MNTILYYGFNMLYKQRVLFLFLDLIDLTEHSSYVIILALRLYPTYKNKS